MNQLEKSPGGWRGSDRPVLLNEPAYARLGPVAGLLDSLGTPWLQRLDEVPGSDNLAGVQSSMMRNYFRLVQAQEALDRRPRARPERVSLVTEQLEGERARLAHELHAGAGQALAGIKIHLEIIHSLLANPPEAVRTSLESMALLVQDALQQLRSIAHRTHPPDWQGLGLREALERLWKLTGIPQKFDATLELPPLPAEPSHPVRVLVYRAAQEALANVIRHAGASRVRLSLASAGDRIRLTVEDNGQGFDRAMMEQAAGIGLRALRTQAELLRGTIQVRGGEQGTTLVLALPVSVDE